VHVTSTEHEATLLATVEGKKAGPLSYPNFRRVWFNNLLYMLVANAQRFTFGWFVLDGLEQKQKWQAVAAFALGIPIPFIVMHAGALADRVDRRKLLMVSQGILWLIVVITTILVATDSLTLVGVIGLALLSGCAQALGQPVRSSLIPFLVPREILFNAIAVNAIAMTMSLILAAPITKIVGDQFGFEGAFGLQVILLTIGMIFLVRVHIDAHEKKLEGGQVWESVKSAVAHVVADIELRVLFLLLVVSSLTVNAAISVTLQAFVRDELGRDGGDVAFPMALMGVGIAMSSVVLMRKGEMRRKGAVFQRAIFCGSSIVTLMGFATEFWQLLPLSFIMGTAGGFYINMNQGLIQANTPPEMMGRIMGLYVMCQAGFMPIGALAIGGIASQVGIGVTISLCGATCLTFVIWTLIRYPQLRDLE
jgi:predicted MFS family arabinose efflux permease